METIQIVLDKGLLQATDRAARRMKRNRSALVREALREHLRDSKYAATKSATGRVMRNGRKTVMNLPCGRLRRRGRQNSARGCPALQLSFA